MAPDRGGDDHGHPGENRNRLPARRDYGRPHPELEKLHVEDVTPVDTVQADGSPPSARLAFVLREYLAHELGPRLSHARILRLVLVGSPIGPEPSRLSLAASPRAGSLVNRLLWPQWVGDLGCRVRFSGERRLDQG